MTETYGLLVLRPLRFRSTLTKRDIFLFGARLSLFIVTPTGTHVGLKRLSIYDFILTTPIEIAESTFQKLGYPRSNNTTTDLRGPTREHHIITGIIMRIEMHQ